MYFPLNIITEMLKSRRTKWVGIYQTLERIPLRFWLATRKKETAGRPRHGWVIYIEVNLTGEGLRHVNRIN